MSNNDTYHHPHGVLNRFKLPDQDRPYNCVLGQTHHMAYVALFRTQQGSEEGLKRTGALLFTSDDDYGDDIEQQTSLE